MISDHVCLWKGMVNKHFSVIADFNLSLVSMISAGEYDIVNLEIKHFNFCKKRKGVENVDFVVKYFNQISVEKSFNELDKEGLRPATIQELLVFGAEHLKGQVSYPKHDCFVALGSIGCISGNDAVAFIKRDNFGRQLGWRFHSRFTVVDDYLFLSVIK